MKRNKTDRQRGLTEKVNREKFERKQCLGKVKKTLKEKKTKINETKLK